MYYCPAAFICTLLAMIMLFSSGCHGIECYSCVSVTGSEDQSSCGDPWRSWRDTLNLITGPPKRICQDACVKIVILNNNNKYDNSVVRTCGTTCNESLAGNTLTSCCTEPLCNTAATLTHARYAHILTICIGILLLFVR